MLSTLGYLAAARPAPLRRVRLVWAVREPEALGALRGELARAAAALRRPREGCSAVEQEPPPAPTPSLDHVSTELPAAAGNRECACAQSDLSVKLKDPHLDVDGRKQNSLRSDDEDDCNTVYAVGDADADVEVCSCSCIRVVAGRPDFSRVLAGAREATALPHVAVLACGPAALVAAAERAARGAQDGRVAVHFHRETFFF
eukprot:tig00000826_g4568.t1